MKNDEDYMRLAIKQAEKAAQKGEVPIGCVITHDGKIIAQTHNLRETKNNPLGHAEILAIRKASRRLKGWRLTGCTLFVTLEPCPMCAGAIINARIPRIVFGAFDPKAGCFGSIHDFTLSGFNHTPEIISGVLHDECSSILKEFFRKKRQ